MRVAKTLEVDAGLAEVWRLITDIEALAGCFPGGKLVEKREDGSYRGEIAIELGHTQMILGGSAQFTVSDTERRMSINARGQDKRGALKVSAEVGVLATELQTRKTEIDVEGAVRLVGPLASAAETGAEQVVDDLAQRFIDCLGARAGGTEPARDAKSSRLSGFSLVWLFLRGMFARRPRRRARERERES